MKIFYWDTSALLSLFLTDAHSVSSRLILQESGENFISSLTIAEIVCSFARLRQSSSPARKTFVKQVDEGYWSLTQEGPALEVLDALSLNYSLRGADLWHLGQVLTLRNQIEKIQLVTFDSALMKAAQSEKCLYQLSFS